VKHRARWQLAMALPRRLSGGDGLVLRGDGSG
jgi:hypothetical protein